MADSKTRSSSRNSSKGLSAKEAVARVREDLPQLLGRPVESVLGVERDDDELWQVTVQVLELSRIPNSTDVLGCYQVNLEADGEIAGYQRQRRYTRGQADDD
jgi:hypothetical protein